MAWAQKDGKDQLTPTRELIATPPIFNLKAGTTQLIRIGMLRKVDLEKELIYRLILEEIPPPPAPDFKGLQVALRIGLPVFIKPDTSAQQFVRDAFGRKIRILTMIDEYTRICLIIHCAMRIGAKEVIEQLADAMVTHGIAVHS